MAAQCAPGRAEIPTSALYYDILFLGKTGIGKSTTGNKMLGLPSDQSAIKQHVSTEEDLGLLRDTGKEPKRFMQAEDVPEEVRHLSVTTQCEVLSTEKTTSVNVDGEEVSMRLRILDVPGFADSGKPGHVQVSAEKGIFEGNLRIIRWIVRIQELLGMKFRRIVYFLPCRGPLEKADGVLQVELRVMYHYFGESIFKRMVLAATNHSLYQHVGPFDTKETMTVFKAALEMVTGVPYEKLPPVIYIGLQSGSEIVEHIKSAHVLAGKDVDSTSAREGLELKIEDNTCIQCSAKIYHTEDNRKFVVTGEQETPYEDSYCHPCFKNKYTKVGKLFGGLGHVLTIGVPYAAGKALDRKVWPGFTNSDEVCVLCKGEPGKAGCMMVNQKLRVKPEDISVVHTNNIIRRSKPRRLDFFRSLSFWKPRKEKPKLREEQKEEEEGNDGADAGDKVEVGQTPTEQTADGKPAQTVTVEATVKGGGELQELGKEEGEEPKKKSISRSQSLYTKIPSPEKPEATASTQQSPCNQSQSMMDADLERCLARRIQNIEEGKTSEGIQRLEDLQMARQRSGSLYQHK